MNFQYLIDFFRDDDAAEKKLAALSVASNADAQWDDEEPKKAKTKAKAPAKKGFAALVIIFCRNYL